MSYKNIIGVCILSSIVLYFVASTFVDGYKAFGWWTLVATPIFILTIIAFWALIQWLLD